MVAEADEVGNISDDLVVTKYKMAAEITNSEYKSSSKRFIYMDFALEVLDINLIL